MSQSKSERRLGRGLSSLLSQPVAVESAGEGEGGTQDVRREAAGDVAARTDSAKRTKRVEVDGGDDARGGGDVAAAGVIESTSSARAREGAASGRGGAHEIGDARVSAARAALDEGASRERAGERAGEDGVVERLLRIPLQRIVTSRHQPRKTMDERALKGLADSIRVSGVMQPVAVREAGVGLYELVAGERRWRAAKIAGLSAIPAVVVRLSDEESASWGLVENMQREDLNPMERAEGLKRLSEEFGLSHGEVAERVGLERPTVANLIRLVELEETIRDRVSSGALTAGHGKALLSVPSGKARVALAKRCESAGWSVRRLEATIAAGAYEGSPGGVRIDDTGDVEETRVGGLSRAQAQARDLEKRLGEHLGTRVRIRTDASGKRGRVVMEFYDLDHFEGLMEKMGFGGEGH